MVDKGFARMNMPDAINRNPMDFYATAERGTRALMACEKFMGRVWEPACGSGSMSRVLETRYKVRSTNLHDLGYGEVGVDFLACAKTRHNIAAWSPTPGMSGSTAGPGAPELNFLGEL